MAQTAAILPEPADLAVMAWCPAVVNTRPHAAIIFGTGTASAKANEGIVDTATAIMDRPPAVSSSGPARTAVFHSRQPFLLQESIGRTRVLTSRQSVTDRTKRS